MPCYLRISKRRRVNNSYKKYGSAKKLFSSFVPEKLPEKIMAKVHNFSAGPGILPQEVLKQASEAVLNFDNLDLSLLEISHRSKNFERVMSEARSLVLELMGLSADSYEVLFLQGGASV